MSFSDWRKKMIGLTEAEAQEATRKRIEQESIRGAKESAAQHLRRAERDYEADPCAINAAYLEQARRMMP